MNGDEPSPRRIGVMAAEMARLLDQRQLNAIALGAAEVDPPEAVSTARATARSALARARARLSERLLAEIWVESATLDVGIWGPVVSDAEAARALRDATERGVIHLDPAPPVEGAGRLRRLLHRLTARA
jgi:hypothetical protein